MRFPMRKDHRLFAAVAAGAALLATPAPAQLVGGQVGADVGAGAQVGLDPGRTVGGVTGTVGDTVDRVDGAVNRTLDSTKLTLATSEQVRAGVEVTDRAGNSVGTVQGVDGDNAIVVDGGRLYNIPLGSLYSSAGDATTRLVTKLPRTQITARAQAGGEAPTR